jgi:hypothetical protein
MYVSFPQATRGPAPISYRGALLNTLLHVCLLPTSHKRPSTYQLQRSATEHSSTCKSPSHKPQQAQHLSVSEERYWALFYINFYTICWMCWYKRQIKWDHKINYSATINCIRWKNLLISMEVTVNYLTWEGVFDITAPNCWPGEGKWAAYTFRV